ncbi:nucleoside deaminase [Maribacter sp. 2308TA10-17]|uniref:nucleoside deaminase n=1 Tax=Maribacter sp. 2308TA10-17 TaxID=3386276 RepID=UPI0039BD0659
MNLHEEFMRYAVKLARIALIRGDEPVGTILVLKGEVIGTGVDSVKTTQNVTNRAEIIAINTAIEFAGAEVLKDSFLYSTREPCLMCSYVIRHYNIPQVIYGTPIDYVGGHTSEIKILETKEVPSWGASPAITTGILEGDIEELSRAPINERSTRRPPSFSWFH